MQAYERLIADPHHDCGGSFRGPRGLKAIIDSQKDMVTVAEAGNGRQAVEAFEQYQPDVTLMDVRIPA